MAKNEVLMLDPAEVQADDNSRFGLRSAAVDALKANILVVGEVQTPVAVSLLPKAEQKGKLKYRLLRGFSRHRAVSELNKSDGAGLKLPALVVEAGDDAGRLLGQVSENVARADLSPMDKAVAMKRLMDAGHSRQAVREMFATTIGKRREPMSNASLNIHLRMLDLPKAIQEDIHNGTVGVAAAYELGKVSPDKRAAVLERAKAEVAKQAGEMEKDEQKFLAAIKRVEDAKAAVATKQKEAEDAKTGIEEAKQTLKSKQLAYQEAKAAFSLDTTKEEQAKALEHVKAAEADVKAAEKLIKQAEGRAKKKAEEAEKAEAIATGQEAKLDAKKKAKKQKPVNKKAIGPADVKKAAEKEGEKGSIALTAAEVRQALKDVGKQADKEGWPVVSAIAQAIKDCLDGKDTPKQLGLSLAQITGEGKKK